MTYNHPVILRTISVVMLFEGIAMLAPVICAAYYKETGPASAFFFVGLCCIAFGFTIFKHLEYDTLRIKTREGYFITFICWFLVCLIATLPYVFADEGISFIDAVFESVAGWTTTGATVFDFNTLPRSLILWKAICNWLGGMGILVLTVSIFPILGAQGQKMAAAEVPGPELEKFSSRMGDTGKITYKIYIAMTIAELCLLLPSGIHPFDAIVNTLSTISTSGVMNVQENMTQNFTPYVKAVINIFSILGSLNFMMYFFIYVGKWKRVLHNIEVRTFLGILCGASLLIAIVLTATGTYDSFFGALGDAFTQSVAFGSTSGYTVGDLNLWPTACKITLIMLVFIGGCGNSTSGGLKVIRFLVTFKLIIRGVYKRIHPRSMKPVMIQKRPVSAENASSITVFTMLFLIVYLFGAFLLSIDNQDIETTLSAALAALSNTGTGFGAISLGDFSIFGSLGKAVSAGLMLCGRLEMYAIIVLFSRSFWNSDRARS